MTHPSLHRHIETLEGYFIYDARNHVIKEKEEHYDLCHLRMTRFPPDNTLCVNLEIPKYGFDDDRTYQHRGDTVNEWIDVITGIVAALLSDTDEPLNVNITSLGFDLSELTENGYRVVSPHHYTKQYAPMKGA